MASPSPEVGAATVSVEEAAGILGIGRSLAYQLAREGRIPSLRLGRRLVVPRHGLESLLNGRAPASGDRP